MRILFLGDIVGSPGVDFVKAALPILRAREQIDCVIANAENASAGSGITPRTYRQLRQAKAPTTSRDRSWRLLLIGIALLLRQLWVLLGQAVSRTQRTRWPAETALDRLRQQLAAALVEGLEEHQHLRLKPKHAAFFQL